jgi:hypothetical protein
VRLAAMEAGTPPEELACPHADAPEEGGGREGGDAVPAVAVVGPRSSVTGVPAVK